MQATPDTSIVSALVFLVIGAALGFIGTYLVQRWGQNRAWKREYILKNVEEIFVPLYKEMHSYFALVEKYDLLPHSIGNTQWNTIRNDYRDLFIEDVLRNKLNQLYLSDCSTHNDKFQNATRKITDIWFERKIKVKVEANGHTFTNEPTRELNRNKFNINIEDAKNTLTELIRNHISKFIFLNRIESEGYIRQELEHRLIYSLSEEEYLRELQALKEEVASLPEILEFERFREQILHELNRLRNMLKERIKKPYGAKL